MLIGSGLALSPIHNKFLTDIATTEAGETALFIPAIGYILLIMGTGLFLMDHWETVKANGWGDRKVLVALTIIVVSMALSGLSGAGQDSPTIQSRVAPMFLGVSLLALYFAARTLGAGLFRAMIPVIVIGVIVAVVLEIVDPYNTTGGIITNSTVTAGFFIFGALVNRGKWQWVLCAAAGLGVLVMGALEGMFVAGVLYAAVVVRRDFDKRFWILSGIAAAVVVAGAGLGYLTPIYAETKNLGTLFEVVRGDVPITREALDAITTGRWTINMVVIENLSLVGHGFTMSVGSGTAHNMLLVIADQVGIAAAVAWGFVTMYGLVKSPWKYAWCAVIAMSVFNHYLWNQMMPFWWVLVGVNLGAGNAKNPVDKCGKCGTILLGGDSNKSDLIFRSNKR